MMYIASIEMVSPAERLFAHEELQPFTNLYDAEDDGLESEQMSSVRHSSVGVCCMLHTQAHTHTHKHTSTHTHTHTHTHTCRILCLRAPNSEQMSSHAMRVGPGGRTRRVELSTSHVCWNAARSDIAQAAARASA
jgi:hypothetical protein